MSDKFCPMPFGSMHIDPDGQIKICCSDKGEMTDDEGRIYNVQTHTLSEAWNSKHYIKIRQEFLNRTQPESCFQCWENEVGENGKSTRTSSLELYKKLDKRGLNFVPHITEARRNNGVMLNYKPVDFQVMAGNLCNLACKMCFPRYSNSWSKFYTKQDITDVKEIKFHRLVGDPEHTYPDFKKEYDWPKLSTMDEVFSEFKDDIYHINITGGEPTLLDQNIEFINNLKSSKNIKNLELMVITNTTNINKKLLDALDGFHHLTLISSLDGMDEIAYIQRTPSHWPQIYKNFKLLREFANQRPYINHYIVTTVTALNIHHVGSFWNFLTLNESNFRPDNISPHFVTSPFQSVGLGIVPKKIIEKIKAQLIQYSSIKDSIPYQRLINYLDNVEWAEDDSVMLEMLDTIQKLHPEMDIKKIYSIYYK
jgi:radical SAM protein with 4Fe4S-binding SPASM domain